MGTALNNNAQRFFDSFTALLSECKNFQNSDLGQVLNLFYSIWAGFYESQLMLTQDLKLTQVLIFLLYKCFSLFMCWVVSDYANSKLKDKQYKKKTSLKSYETEIKILTYPGLA